MVFLASFWLASRQLPSDGIYWVTWKKACMDKCFDSEGISEVVG